MNQLSFQSQGAGGVCLASTPTHSMNIEGYLHRAQILAQLKEYARAIVELRQAVKEYPNNAVCHSRLSVIYFESGQKTMARVHARRSLELDPSNQLSTKIQQKLMKYDIKARATNKTGLMGLFPKKLF